MKKLLDSDWLRAVQFKCNTNAKSVTKVQTTHCNSGLQGTENRKLSKPMTSHKMMTKTLCSNFEKSFLQCEKMASRKIFLHTNFFMFILLN